MKMKKIISILACVGAAFSLAACNDFLDAMPDNRTELDTEDKVVSMLVSAYTSYPYTVICEYASDNMDEMALQSPSYGPEEAEYFRWQDVVTKQANEAPYAVWTGCYSAIASANQALAAIEELGGPVTDKLRAAKGEALVSRAFHHFLLVNIFCQTYNPDFADQDLGIPYMEEAETTLNPQYERGTVAHVYELIDKDLQEGLPLVSDDIYTVPKYHFNVQAAYAFAARFYLFYQKWDECINAANVVLEPNPKGMLRDLEYNGTLGLMSADGQTLLRTMDYIASTNKCNLLMLTGTSEIPGIAFGPYAACTGFNHGNWLDETETFRAAYAPWGSSYTLYSNPYSLNSGSYDKCFAWRCPYLFDIQDAVMMTGYPKTVYPALTGDETLLCRAEAYIMKKEYTSALNDMNTWISNYVKSGAQTLTEQSVVSWAERVPAYTPSSPTPKKEFESPAFSIEAGTQTAMCQALLHLRRVETVHMGLRWFDIKRYGITIYRRKLSAYNRLGSTTDVLHPRDLRCAMQIPGDVVAAGLEANPR